MLVIGAWSLVISNVVFMTSNKSWLPFTVLALALVLWAALFAAGSYLEPSADSPKHDIRKPLIILASMATFLALWAMAMWLRSRRNRPER
jgi:hypothetical protein